MQFNAMVCVCLCAYARTCVRACVRMCVLCMNYLYMFACMQIYLCMHARMRVCFYTYTCVRTYMFFFQTAYCAMRIICVYSTDCCCPIPTGILLQIWFLYVSTTGILLQIWFLYVSTTSGNLDLVQRLEFGVDHLQKNAVYQIE